MKEAPGMFWSYKNKSVNNEEQRKSRKRHLFKNLYINDKKTLYINTVKLKMVRKENISVIYIE